MINGCPAVKSTSLLLLIAFLCSAVLVTHHTGAHPAFRAGSKLSPELAHAAHGPHKNARVQVIVQFKQKPNAAFDSLISSRA